MLGARGLLHALSAADAVAVDVALASSGNSPPRQPLSSGVKAAMAGTAGQPTILQELPADIVSASLHRRPRLP